MEERNNDKDDDDEQRSESVFIPMPQQRSFVKKDRLQALTKIEGTITELQKGRKSE
jgi:hypothetical protein